MAQPIPCDLCQAPEADFLITNRHDGDTLGLCVACLAAFAEQVTSVLDAVAGEAPEVEPVAAGAGGEEEETGPAGPDEAAADDPEGWEEDPEGFASPAPAGRSSGGED